MPYIGTQPTTGVFTELDALTASATADYALTLNGAAYNPATVNNLLVSINGVIQAGSTMSLSGNTLTVGATLSSSDVIDFVRVFGSVGTVSTPTDGSVTTAKIGNNAVTMDKLATSGTLPALNGSALTNLPVASGSVLQVVYADTGTSSNITLSSSGWTSMSLTALVTPSSTSSKILIDFTPQFRMSVNSGSDVGVGWRILRNGSSVEATTSTYHSYFYNNGGFIDSRGTDRVSFLDTPSSTSQLTYTFEGRAYNSAGTNVANNEANKSRVIIMEIAG